ncbi:hypothetical protein MY3296_006803 [Beauveria thailandica]
MVTVLISGANKGIGRALAEKYLAHPDTTVLATVRNPDSKEAKSLLSAPTGAGSRALLLKVESTSDTDALEAIKSAQSSSVDAIDIVIANAGVYTPRAYQPVAQVSLTHLKEHLDINTLGPVRLFQAAFPLLKKSKTPKFILISSIVGTIANLEQIPFPNGAYGGSKAGANFFAKKIHCENPDIISIAIHPGGVKTEAGNEAARAVGFDESFVEVEDSVNAIINKVDGLTRENGSGVFWGIDDTIIPW